MALAILAQNKDISPWQRAFAQHAPDIPVVNGLDNLTDELRAQVSCALLWRHPEGSLAQFPNLQLIASMGAGVDHIFDDQLLDKSIPMVRVVDDFLLSDMQEYLLSVVLHHCRQLGEYRELQAASKWQPKPYRRLSELSIGVLGLGQLGGAVAEYFAQFNCTVSGWSRTPKQLNKVTCFYGESQLATFLSNCNVVILLLPLTAQTQGMVNQRFLAQLPSDTLLINAGRGALIDDEALINALDKRQLNSAALDVFSQEPLPADHRFWTHPHIQITPHVASVTDPTSVVPQIADNYRRCLADLPLLNPVNTKLGY